MSKQKITDEWWTAPAESDSGNLIMVTGRRDMDGVIAGGRYTVRVEITWPYEPEADGMPSTSTSVLMDEVNTALHDEFGLENPVAICTGIYTGDGQRNWVFYVRHLPSFQSKLNHALGTFELLPLEIKAVEDPQWQEYAEMRETEIPDED